MSKVKRLAARRAHLDIQNVSKSTSIPSEADFDKWVLEALPAHLSSFSIVVRIVDGAESRSLNNQYRQQDKPTNVLSFPFESPPGIEVEHLGDLVICAPVVIREARAQNKSTAAHWAHMIVHGILHLQGYDHIKRDQAEEMECLEKTILNKLGFDDPYGSL